MEVSLESRALPRLERADRHVWRSYVRMSDGASRYRIACSLEEALRLVDLPGEEEGRLYCFRRVSLSSIPAQASRQLWMDRVQQVLSSVAAQAVHATDSRACSANAIYFHHRQEALETLLRHALRSQTATDWFSASILGLAPGTSSAMQIPAILERLRQPDIPFGAAATIILAAIGTSDPAPLFAAISSSAIRDWLLELDCPKNLSADPSELPLPDQFRSALHQASCHFGWRDPRTIWLAALMVASLSPSALASGTAVKQARSTLRRLAAAQPGKPEERPISFAQSHARPPGRTARPLIFDDDDLSGTFSSPIETPLSHAPSRRVERAPPGFPPAESLAENPPSGPPQPAADLEVSDRHTPLGGYSSDSFAQNILYRPALLGEPTSGAGLYFLLNVLTRLRISVALESCPALAEAAFVACLLKELAIHADVVRDDPILLCLHPEQTEFTLSQQSLAALPFQANIWPANIPPPRPAAFESHDFLRVWTLAVRRWCWRMGKITVREIVNRDGLVWLTRTDLDITLPMAAIDIRIRRLGLDIDPGWLPWFGEFGRVVRFHFRDR